jgi:HK97 family phage prohead protease
MDCKISKGRDGMCYLCGYANTKGVADRYGDVPAAYNRAFVYDLDEYKKNPVLLIDHVNKIDHVAGSMVDIHEDERGLYFKAGLSDSEYPTVAHARKVYTEGHARGISIAGQFLFENPDKPEQLTLAKIYEISLVAVPADPNALAEAVEKAFKLMETEKSQATEGRLPEIFSALKRLESGMTLSADELRLLTKYANELRQKLGDKDPADMLRKLADLETGKGE